MADQEDISRIAKILARATSSESNEAATALHAAYKRMRRDQVGIKDLLTLPLDELYQESLVKLVSVILEDQRDLAPPERRKAFEKYMSLITERFSSRGESESGYSSRWQASDDERSRHQEAQRKQQEEAYKAKERQYEEELRSQRQQSNQRTTAGGGTKKHEPDMRGSSPTPASPPANSYSLGTRVAVISLIFLFGLIIFSNLVGRRVEVPAPSPAPVESLVPPSREASATHVVAALSANLRAAPTPKSKIKSVLGRGELLTIVTASENFLEVHLTTGEAGFIAQELVIPIADLSRLKNLTAREYVERRLPEKRLENLFNQTDQQKGAFVAVLFGLSNHSQAIGTYLQDLNVSKTTTIDVDSSAGTWFALSANTAMKSGDYENAYWEIRAAIEADPTNPEHHVAFGLTNYKLGNLEAVKVVGRILPRLAPTSTNAWMLFALGSSTEVDSSDELTKAAFVLAIRLSRNAGNTRKYLKDFASAATTPRTKELIYSALAEEIENPNLFASATDLVQKNKP